MVAEEMTAKGVSRYGGWDCQMRVSVEFSATGHDSDKGGISFWRGAETREVDGFVVGSHLKDGWSLSVANEQGPAWIAVAVLC